MNQAVHVRRWARVRVALRVLTRAGLAGLMLVVGLLAACQSQLIYHPRPYPAGVEALPGVRPIEFTTGQGRQVAFWVGPRAGGEPRRVWVCHAGNGSLALDWLGFLETHPEQDVGFLLVDYPGYGRCEGSSTPARILANSEGAVAALAKHLGMPAGKLQARVAVLGHSLGAAGALQYAARHPVERVVLIAPFTSMGDMADRTLCWPMHCIVVHRFDNRARLAELATRTPPPPVVILHGTSDSVIPLSMGRELANAHKDFVRLIEIPNGQHNLSENFYPALSAAMEKGEN